MNNIKTLLYEGFMSGLAAGILMGLISHAAFRFGVFRSSLLIIDGAFALKSLGMKYDEMHSVLLGIPVHLVTSISFGLSYAALIYMSNVEPTNVWMITAYIFMLWFSMLFVALPVAGHGLLGRRLATTVWLEQLILHIIFGVGLGGTIHLLQQ